MQALEINAYCPFKGQLISISFNCNAHEIYLLAAFIRNFSYTSTDPIDRDP